MLHQGLALGVHDGTSLSQVSSYTQDIPTSTQSAELQENGAEDELTPEEVEKVQGLSEEIVEETEAGYPHKS